jgi:transcription elongation GreA/GreB family factor
MYRANDWFFRNLLGPCFVSFHLYLSLPMPPKPHFHQVCLNQLQAKIDRLNRSIAEAQQAASEDTKSSAGDKFETSREMMKQEINKLNAQLSQAVKMQQQLGQVNPEASKETVGFGSLVQTNEGLYYFSVSLGKVEVAGQSCFALSMASPLGKALAGKKAGEAGNAVKGVVIPK